VTLFGGFSGFARRQIPLGFCTRRALRAALALLSVGLEVLLKAHPGLLKNGAAVEFQLGQTLSDVRHRRMSHLSQGQLSVSTSALLGLSL